MDSFGVKHVYKSMSMICHWQPLKKISQTYGDVFLTESSEGESLELLNLTNNVNSADVDLLCRPI